MATIGSATVPAGSTAREPGLCSGATDTRRESPRYLITRSIYAVGVLPDGRPDRGCRGDGFTVDISSGGVCFELATRELPATDAWMVGIEASDGRLRYVGVQAVRVTPGGAGLQIQGRFLEPRQDPLRTERLVPHLDLAAGRFVLPLSEDVLQAWQQAGVVERRVLDRILTCPDCGGMPTLRQGCRACGSSFVNSDRLLHHYACAYVGFAREFEQAGELVCPKCLTRSLVVGADFEYQAGPFRCRDCGWADSRRELYGQCLGCDLRFALAEAQEQELVGYHVERVAPLDLVPAR
jgi:hypothetical protein